MAHVVTELDTTVSPERVIRALTDFSPRRFELWPNVERQYFKVESSGDTTAEVTEGSSVFGGVWERGLYDWSRPGTVRIEVKDSNAFKPGSYWLYEVTAAPGGGSHVHMEFDRRPANLRGILVSTALDLFGQKIFTKQLGETLRRLEASSDKATTPDLRPS
jgi:Polyketide cyclase / dehydrase and lipid transport